MHLPGLAAPGRGARTRAVAVTTAVALLAGCTASEDETGSPSGDSPGESEEAAGPSRGDDGADDGARDRPATAPDDEPGDEPDPSPAPPEEIVPYEDPDELAEELRRAELALADPAISRDDLAAWAGVHQQAYRDLVHHPPWREQARAQLPEELHLAFDRTLHAGQQLWELTEPREQLPDWRIEAPPPVEQLREHYGEAEEEFGVPWHVLAAIHLVETRFGRIRGDSHVGAQGPMQFMPGTWEAYGEGDVHDPRDAIMAAGRYLAASGAPEDLEAALFAYNRSDRYVEAVLAHAEVMAHYDHYLDVYHGWRVYYRTVADGDVVLEEGYGAP